MVTDLNDRLFREKIFNYEEGKDAPLRTNKSTIIEFWVNWCSHCQAMVPRYEEVSKKFNNVDFYRIELEQHPDLAKIFGVASFPTFIFITKNGKIEKYVGEVSEKELTHMVKEILGE